MGVCIFFHCLLYIPGQIGEELNVEHLPGIWCYSDDYSGHDVAIQVIIMIMRMVMLKVTGYYNVMMDDFGGNGSDGWWW